MLNIPLVKDGAALLLPKGFPPGAAAGVEELAAVVAAVLSPNKLAEVKELVGCADAKRAPPLDAVVAAGVFEEAA